jgi:hypothetical protein
MFSSTSRVDGCAINLRGTLSAIAPSAALMEQNFLLERSFIVVSVSHRSSTSARLDLSKFAPAREEQAQRIDAGTG